MGILDGREVRGASYRDTLNGDVTARLMCKQRRVDRRAVRKPSSLGLTQSPCSGPPSPSTHPRPTLTLCLYSFWLIILKFITVAEGRRGRGVGQKERRGRNTTLQDAIYDSEAAVPLVCYLRCLLINERHFFFFSMISYTRPGTEGDKGSSGTRE